LDLKLKLFENFWIMSSNYKDCWWQW